MWLRNSPHSLVVPLLCRCLHYRGKYLHYSGNRHYSARCHHVLVVPSVPSDFTGTAAGNRHYKGEPLLYFLNASLVFSLACLLFSFPQGAVVKKAWGAQRDFLVMASACKKPEPSVLAVRDRVLSVSTWVPFFSCPCVACVCSETRLRFQFFFVCSLVYDQGIYYSLFGLACPHTPFAAAKRTLL